MHPSLHAQEHPDKPAIIMAGSGETRSYAELDQASNRYAQLYRAEGLKIGDTVALFLDN
ncbi:MAG: AMP-binding protein, partial [Pseudomonadota bacterium]